VTLLDSTHVANKPYAYITIQSLKSSSAKIWRLNFPVSFWHYGRFDKLQAVAYLEGGHGAMPPFGPTMKFFLQTTVYEKVLFAIFSARIAKFNNV